MSNLARASKQDSPNAYLLDPSKRFHEGSTKSQPTVDSSQKVKGGMDPLVNQLIRETENESQDTNHMQKITQTNGSEQLPVNELSYSLSKQTSQLKDASASKKAIKDILNQRQDETNQKVRRQSLKGKRPNNRRVFQTPMGESNTMNLMKNQSSDGQSPASIVDPIKQLNKTQIVGSKTPQKPLLPVEIHHSAMVSPPSKQEISEQKKRLNKSFNNFQPGENSPGSGSPSHISQTYAAHSYLGSQNSFLQLPNRKSQLTQLTEKKLKSPQKVMTFQSKIPGHATGQPFKPNSSVKKSSARKKRIQSKKVQESDSLERDVDGKSPEFNDIGEDEIGDENRTLDFAKNYQSKDLKRPTDRSIRESENHPEQFPRDLPEDMIMQLNSRQSMPHNNSASHQPVPMLELAKLVSDPGPFNYQNPVNKTQDLGYCEDMIDENEEHPDLQTQSKKNLTMNPTAGPSNAFQSRTSSFNKTSTNADISPLIKAKADVFKKLRNSIDSKMRRKKQEPTDFGLSKFQLNRSKSINYITNPQGNLGMYFKKPKMLRGNSPQKLQHFATMKEGQLDLILDKPGHRRNQSKGTTVVSVADIEDSRESVQEKFSHASRYMDYQKKPKMEGDKKQAIMERYMTLQNRVGLNVLKPEYDGVKQQKEDTMLVIQDQKRQLIYDKEEITVMKMQNSEYKRKIAVIQKETADIIPKQITAKSQINQAYEDLFSANESVKLYEKTITELKKAIQTERVYVQTVKEQVKELRALLAEEVDHKEQYKGLSSMQKKQINSLAMKHLRNTGELERGLTAMNKNIQDCIEAGAVTIKQLDRKTNNMIANQQSQFFMSKYTQSKMMMGSINYSKLSTKLGGPTSPKKGSRLTKE